MLTTTVGTIKGRIRKELTVSLLIVYEIPNVAQYYRRIEVKSHIRSLVPKPAH